MITPSTLTLTLTLIQTLTLTLTLARSAPSLCALRLCTRRPSLPLLLPPLLLLPSLVAVAVLLPSRRLWPRLRLVWLSLLLVLLVLLLAPRRRRRWLPVGRRRIG